MNKKKFINNIMTELHKINVKLSEGQKRKLAKAYRDNEEVSIKLAHKNLSGSDTLMVPKNTVNRVAKSKGLGKGVQIKISKANVRKQTGSGILSSLLPVLRNVAKCPRSIFVFWNMIIIFFENMSVNGKKVK